MTSEEKQLLIKAICEMLPYGVHCCVFKLNENIRNSDDILYGVIGDNVITLKCDEDECLMYYQIKPYLRPMSSMTEDEWKEYNQVIGKSFSFTDEVDWLNVHYFDYRGLIEKGLALEAPDGMYNKEESEKGSEIPIPKTVDEAVKTLAKIVSKEDRDYILENGAISVHNSLGRWIRNEWGLWTDSELKNELKKKGFEHPDDMSNYIIEEFIKYWNNKL